MTVPLAFLQFSRNKTGEYDFSVHSNNFYTETIPVFSYNACSLNFHSEYAEIYISLKGNGKAISILHNVIYM